MKTLITCIFTTIITFSALGQYTQNLDNMSRKEIRRLILNQDGSQKGKGLIYAHQGFKFISVIGYTLGGIGLLNSEKPSNDQEVDLAGIYGILFIGTAAVFTLLSEVAYFSAKEAYLNQTPKLTPKTKIYLRDSSGIYDGIRH